MNAIFKRELRSYFHGMLGYLLTAFLLASSGIGVPWKKPSMRGS